MHMQTEIEKKSGKKNTTAISIQISIEIVYLFRFHVVIFKRYAWKSTVYDVLIHLAYERGELKWNHS